jgi:hypothetical protein
LVSKKTVLFLFAAALGIGVGLWMLQETGSEDSTQKRVQHDSARGEAVQNEMVRVHAPSPKETVESPLQIEGEARGGWFFEASFPIRLLSEDGSVIAEHHATAQDEWMTEEFVPFSGEILFSHPGEGSGWLILHRSNPSGLPAREEALRIPVRFADVETMKVSVYFGRQGATQCEETGAVPRVITRTKTPARAALEHLLAGPTLKEREQGHFSPIPPGVTIEELSIVEGTGEVDFSEQLKAGAGGSCRARAIRSQIENTLLQFSTVDSVVISVDGRFANVLQP